MMSSDVTLPINYLAVSSKPSKTGKEESKHYVNSENQSEMRSLSVVKSGSSSTEPVKRECMDCAKDNHLIANWKKFKALDVDGRWKAVEFNNWCLSCFVTHCKCTCRTKKECEVGGCKVNHQNSCTSQEFVQAIILRRSLQIIQKLWYTEIYIVQRHIPTSVCQD